MALLPRRGSPDRLSHYLHTHNPILTHAVLQKSMTTALIQVPPFFCKLAHGGSPSFWDAAPSLAGSQLEEWGRHWVERW